MSAVLIAAHASGASLALTLGAVQLVRRRKGDRGHRLAGRVWVAAMYWTIVSSFFIRSLNPGHFSWIHGLSLFTFVTLTLGLWSAVRGRIDLHRRFMRGTYFGLLGAFVGAVAVPQRDVPQLAVHHPVVFATAVLGIAAATAAVLAICFIRPRSPGVRQPVATPTAAPGK